jgi:hypothetical protein
MGPSVCSAVLFFRHWFGSARDAARPCRSRHLLPLAARPKTARSRGERRGHRVRGLWCFEEADPGRPQRPLGRTPNTKLCARPPRHVVTRKTVAGHSPAPVRLMSSAAPGLISGRCSARRAGQHSAVLPGAVQRPTARPDPFVGSCAHRFGLSGRPVLWWQGHAGRDLTSKLANDDRAKCGRGLTV